MIEDGFSKSHDSTIVVVNFFEISDYTISFKY